MRKSVAIASLGLGWIVSVGAVYQLARSSSGSVRDLPADRIQVEGAQAEGAKPQVFAGALEAKPHASTYGYSRLGFSLELVSELAWLHELHATEPEKAFVLFRQLTGAMDEEAVIDCLRHLNSNRLAGHSRRQERLHLSWRLGQLLGFDGVGMSKRLGAQVDSTFLGWCAEDPAEAWNWMESVADDTEWTLMLDNWGRERIGRWLMRQHPDRTLAIIFARDEVPFDPALITGVREALNGSGQWALLSPYVARFTTMNEPSAAILLDEMARAETRDSPFEVLSSLEGMVALTPYQNLRWEHALNVVAEQSPLRALELSLRYPHEGDLASKRVGSVVYERSKLRRFQHGLLEELSRSELEQLVAGNVDRELSNFATWMLYSKLVEDSGGFAAWDFIEDATMPTGVKRRLQLEAALAMIDRDPTAANAQLWGVDHLSPALAQLIREGAPAWEIRMSLEDAIRRSTYFSMSEEETAESVDFFGDWMVGF